MLLMIIIVILDKTVFPAKPIFFYDNNKNLFMLWKVFRRSKKCEELSFIVIKPLSIIIKYLQKYLEFFIKISIYSIPYKIKQANYNQY